MLESTKADNSSGAPRKSQLCQQTLIILLHSEVAASHAFLIDSFVDFLRLPSVSTRRSPLSCALFTLQHTPGWFFSPFYSQGLWGITQVYISNPPQDKNFKNLLSETF